MTIADKYGKKVIVPEDEMNCENDKFAQRKERALLGWSVDLSM
ncbi:MAG: hypothetical protein OEY31_09330 [Candidatus Bathyarchaeota archaeon]|nr:hypothetical protein [Candidatus Bathyarchaeota archaeon]